MSTTRQHQREKRDRATQTLQSKETVPSLRPIDQPPHWHESPSFSDCTCSEVLGPKSRVSRRPEAHRRAPVTQAEQRQKSSSLRRVTSAERWTCFLSEVYSSFFHKPGRGSRNRHITSDYPVCPICCKYLIPPTTLLFLLTTWSCRAVAHSLVTVGWTDVRERLSVASCWATLPEQRRGQICPLFLLSSCRHGNI